MSQGGSYIREKDGALTLVQRTEVATTASAVEGGASSAPAAEADGAAASAVPPQPSRKNPRKEI